MSGPRQQPIFGSGLRGGIGRAVPDVSTIPLPSLAHEPQGWDYLRPPLLRQISPWREPDLPGAGTSALAPGWSKQPLESTMTDQPIEQDKDPGQPGQGDTPGQTPADNQPGQKPGSPATGGEGSQGAGGPAGFGTGD